MRCLVVAAHPLAESLCAEMARRTRDFLRAAGHVVIFEDLYDAGFDPVMTPEERKSDYDGPYRAEDIAGSTARLTTAEGLVLVFPTWWFGFPAVRKGWFDRVWAPGIANDHAPDFGPIRPKLHRLRKMLAVTSPGAPWWVDRILMRQPVKKVLKTALAGTCAPRCRFHMVSMYKCEKRTPAQVERFWSRIRRALSSWGDRTQGSTSRYPHGNA